MANLNPWEFRYPHKDDPNALTFGGATNYGLIRVEGLSPTDVKVEEIEKPEADGSFVFAKFRTARRIRFSGDIRSDGADFEAQVTALKKAFLPQSEVQPLDFYIPGDGNKTKTVYCVPTRVDFPIDLDYSIETAFWNVELLAEDPRILITGDGGAGGGVSGGGVGGEGTNQLELFLAALGGLDFGGGGDGLDFGGGGDGLDFGGGGTDQGTATNNGSDVSFPTARIDGPVTNPRLRNLTRGEHVQVNLTLASGQFLDIDFENETVLLNGTQNRFGDVTSDSEFWSLNVGANSIQFTGTDSGGSTKATLSWNDVAA